MLRHKSEFQAALWFGGAVLTLMLLVLGVRHLQVDVGGRYRLKIETLEPSLEAASRKERPPITRGWEPEVKTGE